MSILINLGFPAIRYCSFPGFKTIGFYTILDIKESLIDRIHLIPVSLVSYAQEVSDSINGYVKMKVSYGSCQIVKTSEDGKVDGINFTITGNGINQTVTTANGGKFQIDNLMPGIYTVTEQAYDKYEPQETHRVTVVAGQIAKVTFNNKLKRGDLQVVKSSEDNLVEGVKFHLFGTSLSGDAVDQYAVTDKNGVARNKYMYVLKSSF